MELVTRRCVSVECVGLGLRKEWILGRSGVEVISRVYAEGEEASYNDNENFFEIMSIIGKILEIEPWSKAP